MKKSRYIDMLGCVLCNCKPSACHHIKTRGSGGRDEWWNIVPLCGAHHSECHTLGDVEFMRRYGEYSEILEARGWEVLRGKLIYNG